MRNRKRATRPAAPIEMPKNAPPIEKTQRSINPWIIALIPAAVGFFVFANTINNEFVADDWTFIGANPALENPISLARIFTSTFWEAMGAEESSAYYRPLVALVKMLEFRLFEFKPAGYHLISNLLHAANAAAFFLLAMRWLRHRKAALVSALLFAVHPIHTQSVAMISGMTDVLATLFVLLALLVLPKNPGEHNEPASRAILRQGLAASAFLLGLFSKEVAIVFPSLLVIQWWLSKRSLRLALFPPGKYRFFFFVLIIPFAFWLMLRSYALSDAGFESQLEYAYGPWTRVLTISKIYGFYFLKLIIPYPLSYESGVFAASGPADPAGYFWLLVLAGLLLGAWKLKVRQPAIAFSILWLLLGLIPSSNIIPLTDLAKEHFAYLPSVGFCLMAGGLLLLIPSTARYKSRQIYTLAALYTMIAVFAVLTFRQNQIWKDKETFWQHVVELLPEIPQEVIENPHYQETVSAYPVAYLALGNELAEQRKWREAEEVYREGLQYGPDSPDLNHMMGTAKKLNGDSEGALSFFQRALAEDESFEPAAISLAEIEIARGNAALAAEVLEKAEPSNGSGSALYYYMLADAYANSNSPDKAAEVFAILEQHPDLSPPMRLNTAAFFYNQGRPEDAVRWLRPVRVAPPDPMYLAALAEYLIAAGEMAEARSVTAELKSSSPNNPRLSRLEELLR